VRALQIERKRGKRELDQVRPEGVKGKDGQTTVPWEYIRSGGGKHRRKEVVDKPVDRRKILPEKRNENSLSYDEIKRLSSGDNWYLHSGRKFRDCHTKGGERETPDVGEGPIKFSSVEGARPRWRVWRVGGRGGGGWGGGGGGGSGVVGGGGGVECRSVQSVGLHLIILNREQEKMEFLHATSRGRWGYSTGETVPFYRA